MTIKTIFYLPFAYYNRAKLLSMACKPLFIWLDSLFSALSPATYKHPTSSYTKNFNISHIIMTIHASIAYFAYANF